MDHSIPSVSRRERTLEEIVRAKRPRSLRSVDELMAPDVFPSQAEVGEFVQAYRRDRQAGLDSA